MISWGFSEFSFKRGGGGQILGATVLAVAVGVGLVESLLARFALRRVPLLLTTGFLLCLFALLATWRGGGG